jgi:hypothetical protein
MPKELGDIHIVKKKFYTVIETGLKGLNTKTEASLGEVVTKGDDTIIRFNPVSPDVLEKIKEAYHRNEVTLADAYNAKLFEMAAKAEPSKVHQIVRFLSEKEFIRLEGTDRVKYELSVFEEHWLDSNIFVLRNGDIDKEAKPKPKDLLLEDKNGWFRISKFEKVVHDWKANLYALCDVCYVYPKDESAILEKFPALAKFIDNELYESEKEKSNELRNCGFSPRVVTGKLGDKTIRRKVVEDYKQLAIQADVFQFAASPDNSDIYGVCGDMRRGEERVLRITDDAVAITCIEVSGQYNLIVYKYDKIIEGKNGFYASYNYKEESGFFTPGTHEVPNRFGNAEKILYTYLYMDIFEPVKISMDEYKAWPVNL